VKPPVFEYVAARSTEEALAELARHGEDAKLLAAIEPESDIHATADYRRHVAGVLAVRALRLAAERALLGGGLRAFLGGELRASLTPRP
jgi:carbon-monoxide dehydrogenase medium subunit